MFVVPPEHGVEHQVGVVEQVVERRGDFTDEQEQVFEDRHPFSRIQTVMALAPAVLLVVPQKERLCGLAQAKQREVAETSLESLILVDELQQFEHFTRGSDLFYKFGSGGDPRILRKVLVVPQNQALEMTVQKVSRAGFTVSPIRTVVVVILLKPRRNRHAKIDVGQATALLLNQLLQVLVIEDAVHRERLVRLRHALHVEHDYVLDQAKDLVPPPISLHNGHQILHLIHSGLTYPPGHLFRVVQGLL